MKHKADAAAPARKKRRLWLIPVILFLLLAIVGGIAVISDSPSRQELASLTMAEIDFSNLNDGTYTGSFAGVNGSQRDATVEVTVSNGEPTRFRVLKGAVNEQGTPTDLGNGLTVIDLFERVQEADSLQVDIISGATLTSNAHLKALEDALQQAQKTP